MRRALAFALLAISCGEPDPGSTGDGNDDGNDDTIFGPDDVILDDTSGGLSVEVVGGTATSWRLGAIEPRVDIYEEGCRDDGDICHSLDGDGGTIGWTSDCASNGDGTTCIAQLYWRQGVMSFVIRPASGVGCWAWGDDAADYYDGCTITDWAPDSY